MGTLLFFFPLNLYEQLKRLVLFFSVEHFSVLITSLFVAATSPERSSSSLYLFFNLIDVSALFTNDAINPPMW